MSSSLKCLKKGITFFNSYGFVEYAMLFKFQRFSFRKSDKEPMFISMVDSRRCTRGFIETDLRGLDGVSALTKVIDMPFERILFN